MSNLGQFFGGDSNIRNIYPLDGPFGTGKLKFFYRSGTFRVPNGISTVRVRMWGAGGYVNDYSIDGIYTAGESSCSIDGQKVFRATGSTRPLQSSSFIPGEGDGGDVNTTGGSQIYGGGGGAANLFGNGGVTSGNGGHLINVVESGGNGIAGNGGLIVYSNTTLYEIIPATGHVLGINSIDLIGCGGGGYYSANFVSGGDGVNGGGGGCGSVSSVGIQQFRPGRGGFPGGGDGGFSNTRGTAGGGFSMKTITGLTSGAEIAVTVGTSSAGHNNGLVIIEY
jgi:hypothetical protein